MQCLASASLVLALLLAGSPGRADTRRLTCGVPYTTQLATGERHEYGLDSLGPGVVAIDAIDVSGTIDLLALESNHESTCAGSIVLDGENRKNAIKVWDCRNEEAGRYTIEANIVSDSNGNCSMPIPCGPFPYIRRFGAPGQVDAYSFFASAGDHVKIRGTNLDKSAGRLRFRVFDPDGESIAGNTTSCGGFNDLQLDKTGRHTVLVSSCGEPAAGLYKISFDGPQCPTGPEITFLGLARADGVPLSPDQFDGQGRPVYQRDFGAGFVLIAEGRPGRSGVPVGTSAFDYSPADPAVLPDLQMLVSRNLGNGSTMVCDSRPPQAGGVPATPRLEFDGSDTIAAAINDLTCRADDGTGEPKAVSSQDACTSFSSGDFGFVEPLSTLQYCMIVSPTWSFPNGATTVKARMRDLDGNVGAPREMIVQVGDVCGGDCNGDTEVTVDEIVLGVATALDLRPVLECPAMDGNSDGQVQIDELIAAVSHALNGCGKP